MRLALAIVLVAASAAAAYDRPAKKLLEYGWDVPYPDYVRAHIREMEARPFDGLVFRLRDLNFAFDPRPYDQASYDEQIADLEAIAWGTFTDNFLTLYAANDLGMDWYNDAQWEQITANMRQHAAAARAGRCVGICFDFEPYGADPWAFAAEAGRTFDEAQAVVRRRGRQFVEALQADWPDLKLLTLFQLSFLGHLADIADPAERDRRLAAEHYALLPAFCNGLLEGAAPGVRIIDGNEGSYYYNDSESFYRAYQNIARRLQVYIDPVLREKYTAQVRVGMALYVDQCLAMRGDTKVLQNWATADERLDWWEHHVWHCLNASDEYVWLYSERMNWWRGPIPQGLEERAASARLAVAEGRPCRVDLRPIAAAARARREAEVQARLIDRRATVTAAPPPDIDGRLDDTCWTTPLQRFVRAVSQGEADRPEAGTEAWLSYDDAALYVAFRCAEPTPDRLHCAGDGPDSAVWQGDCVELFVSLGEDAVPFRHFILNPHNVPWDGADMEDVTWNGDWRHACAVGTDHWTAELAVPWDQIGGRPAPGTARRLNLCRQRGVTGELSAWNAVVTGFIEPERFGTVVF